MPVTDMFDPTVFDPALIDLETKQFNEGVEKLLSEAPPIYTLQPQEIRDNRESGQSAFGEIVIADEAEERTIPGPAGDIPLRMFIPDEVNGVYLHIHGGGHMLGRAHHQDPALLAMAKEAGVAVVSVDYRLAPENHYPAGPDDCEAAAVWLIENAKSEFGSEKLTIGGESAGATLTTCTLLRLRDKHDYTDFRAANLIYGCYDANFTPSVRRWGERNLILNTRIIEWFYENYVTEDQRNNPDVSTLHADLSNMPPALFTV
ncbi:MAG: alpha/beta hydrolase fold domain-containing protein, partial [Deltaproteobacteria bacterium]|nr:alpha/beta hydrolase fold domain-containing protein [Deltaproteobacteria bacterium]